MPKDSSPIKLLLALALFVASWQFSALALGKSGIISPDVVASRSTPTKSREHANAFGVDGTGCRVPKNDEGQPSHDSVPSDSSSDIEHNDADLDDLRADPSLRTDQDTPHFSGSGVGAGATRVPRIVGVFLLPISCFYCLHEHIRERAPPILV